MIQISYVSRATAPMSADDLLALLRQCLTNNPGSAVTGMLFYANETFLQTLEGEEEDVERLLLRIKADPRNTDVQLLHRRPIQRREYSDWSMGFRRLTDNTLVAAGAPEGTTVAEVTPLYLVRHRDIVEQLFREHIDPNARTLDLIDDPRDQLARYLKAENTRMRGQVELALLMLESVTDATRRGGVTERHLQLCEDAIQALRHV
jgi:hypothetical protein